MPKTVSMNRRRFAQLLGVGAAYVAVRPQLALASKLSLDPIAVPVPRSLIRLSSNENPYGPSSMALRAMRDAFSLAWRYPDEHADTLIEMLAKAHAVSRDHILLGNGSGEILKLCAAAFTGPGRGKLVVADPTFEAILNHARIAGAEVLKVPLTPTFAHDLAKMRLAANGGLVYICNPNNPTASLTPKKDLRDFILNCPRETMILVDEAYHHYVDSADYESVIPLIKQHPNLIVARTFSKIYGMAGLRCGYCIAQPETIKRLQPHQAWDSVNIMALAAAIGSLKDADHVPNGRRVNRGTRNQLSSGLERIGFQHIPSQANFVMIDVKRPVTPLLDAMRRSGVQVGRLFPSLPNHMRVTVGRPSEVQAFLSAFRQVSRLS